MIKSEMYNKIKLLPENLQVIFLTELTQYTNKYFTFMNTFVYSLLMILTGGISVFFGAIIGIFLWAGAVFLIIGVIYYILSLYLMFKFFQFRNEFLNRWK